MMIRFSLLPVTLCAALLSACSSDDPAMEQEGELTWRSCPEDASLNCATLRVPMNDSSAEAEKIDLAISCLPARQ